MNSTFSGMLRVPRMVTRPLVFPPLFRSVLVRKSWNRNISLKTRHQSFSCLRPPSLRRQRERADRKCRILHGCWRVRLASPSLVCYRHAAKARTGVRSRPNERGFFFFFFFLFFVQHEFAHISLTSRSGSIYIFSIAVSTLAGSIPPV